MRRRSNARGLATEEAGPVELAGSQRVHAVVDEMLEALLEEDRRMRSARGDERTRVRILVEQRIESPQRLGAHAGVEACALPLEDRVELRPLTGRTAERRTLRGERPRNYGVRCRNDPIDRT